MKTVRNKSANMVIKSPALSKEISNLLREFFSANKHIRKQSIIHIYLIIYDEINISILKNSIYKEENAYYRNYY
ncbi:hypothetical protein [Clostridium sp. Marseille-QA1073]